MSSGKGKPAVIKFVSDIIKGAIQAGKEEYNITQWAMTGKNKTASWNWYPHGLRLVTELIVHTWWSIWALKSVYEVSDYYPILQMRKEGPQSPRSRSQSYITKSWIRSPKVFPVTTKSLLFFVNWLPWSQTLSKDLSYSISYNPYSSPVRQNFLLLFCRWGNCKSPAQQSAEHHVWERRSSYFLWHTTVSSQHTATPEISNTSKQNMT